MLKTCDQVLQPTGTISLREMLRGVTKILQRVVEVVLTALIVVVVAIGAVVVVVVVVAVGPMVVVVVMMDS
jgi:hypothetical protein